MRKHWFISVFLPMIAICACNKINVQEGEVYAVEFSSPYVQETKASAELVSDVSGMVTGSGELGYSVYGLKMAVNPSGAEVSDFFMQNEKVYSKDGGATWMYDDIKYWSPSAKHYFFALYPYFDDSDDTYDLGIVYERNKEEECIDIKGSNGDLYTGQYVGSAGLSTSPDILYGMSLHSELFDVSTVPEKVSFDMKHAFAAICFRIKNVSEYDISSLSPGSGDMIRVTGLYNASTSLSLSADGAVWPVSVTGDDKIYTSSDFEFRLDEISPGADSWSTGEYYPSENEAWYTALVIPQDFSSLTVSLEFSVKFSEGTDKTYSLTLSDYPVGSTAGTRYVYQAGNKYVYELSISGTAIACQVNVVDWIEDEFIELN